MWCRISALLAALCSCALAAAICEVTVCARHVCASGSCCVHTQEAEAAAAAAAAAKTDKGEGDPAKETEDEGATIEDGRLRNRDEESGQEVLQTLQKNQVCA
jgi:hypothetical protein